MAQTWYKTDTAADNSGTKCDSTTLATNPFYVECALTDPSPSGSNTITLPAKASYTVGAFESPSGIGVSSIPAGTWTINLNVTGAASSGSQWQEIHICEIQPGGTNVKTIGSNTGLAVDIATTGNKQGTVTLGSPVSVTSTNHWYIQLVFYSNAHAGTSVTIDRTLTIVDTISAPTTHDLAGTVAAQSTFTGNATVQQAQWALAGAIAVVSAFTGNATVVKPTHALAGSIAAQSTFTGDATVTQAQWALAGTVAAQSALTGDLTVQAGGTTHVLAGSVGAQSAFTGDAKRLVHLDAAGEALVDSESSPATLTTYDANADCHVSFTFTNEDTNNVIVAIRYLNPNSQITVECRADIGGNPLRLQYADGTWHEVASVSDIFGTDVEFTVDVYALGSNIRVLVDDSEEINETVTYNQTQTGGRITHTLDTNDLELESYSYPGSGIVAQSAFTGSLTVTTPPIALAGTIGAVSDFTGNLTVTQAQWALAGSVVAQSAFTGDLVVSGTHALAGSIGAQSALTGDLTVQQAQWTLAGSIGATSTLTGDLAVLEKHALAGTVGVVSALTGQLTVTGVHQLAGTVGVVSAFTGALGAPVNFGIALLPSTSWPDSVVTADQDDYGANWEVGAYIYSMQSLAGVVGAQSALTGNLVVSGQVALAGDIAAQSALTGQLAISGVKVLAGTIGAASTVTGALTLDRKLEGTIGAVSTFTGQLNVTGVYALAGTIGATSALTADLEVTKPLAGAIAGVSALVGDLTVERDLAGAVGAAASLVGALKITRGLGGDLAVISTITGTLAQRYTLAGAIAAQSSFTGDVIPSDAAREFYALTSHIKLTAAMESDIALTAAMDSDLHQTHSLTCAMDLEEVA